MRGYTHMLAGLTVSGGYFLVTKQPVQPGILAMAAVGSLLPDIDHEYSTISQEGVQVGGIKIKPLKPIAMLINKTFGHRTITHCFLGFAILALISSPLLFFDPMWWVAFCFFGIASHYITDAMTKSGLMLFYPFKKDSYHLLPKFMRITTGGAGEAVVIGVLLLLLFLFCYGAFSTHGVHLDKGAQIIANYFKTKIKIRR